MSQLYLSRVRGRFLASVILFQICPAVYFSAGTSPSAGETRWQAPASQAQKHNPVPATQSSLAAGRKIYLKRCASCHGKTGNGDGPDAVDLGIHPAKFSDPSLSQEPDGALFWKITVGKKPMPDYGDRLSPNDRWNVINFLRTLGTK